MVRRFVALAMLVITLAGCEQLGLPLQVTIEGVSPQVVGAVSTSNTTVVVSFTESMADGAEVASNYAIVQENVNPEVGALGVLSATLSDDGTAVTLTTRSQNEVTYRVTVVDVKDAGGEALEVDIVNGGVFVANSAAFAGTPPSAGGGTLVDSDGDGLYDNEEQLGYVVFIELANGEVIAREVTSDPDLPDTDGDGLSDYEEVQIGTSARSVDTDGDGLSDEFEWNTIFSSPFAQDTDLDGLVDNLEHDFYQTSPILADTDGDRLSDSEELLELNRDPRVADLPKLGISVGDVRLQIDERYTYTDEFGQTLSQESSSSTTLAQSQDTSFTESEGNVTEWTIGGSLRVGIGTGQFFGGDKGLAGGAELTVAGGYTNTDTKQTDFTSAQGAQQVYENSLTKGRELSRTSAVTREVFGARVDVDLTVENLGTIPFSVSNLEITVLQRSPIDSSRLVPVATLVSNSELITGTPLVVSLGPFTTERGPFLFTSREVFPNLVEALMRNAQGLVFKVANFDLTDELGRNFVFSDQTARDRTAGITFDYGDAAAAETFLVATSGAVDDKGYAGGRYVGGWDEEGRPKALPLDYVLQDILGLTKNDTARRGIIAGTNRAADSTAQGDDVQLIPVGTQGLSVGSIVVDPGDNGILDSAVQPGDVAEFISGYETGRFCDTASGNPGAACSTDGDCTGSGRCAERLVRVGSLKNGDFNRGWYVLYTGRIPAAADFGEISVEPGEDLVLAFLQDLDGDGLFAREEFLAGSIDSSADNLDNALFGELPLTCDVFSVNAGDACTTNADCEVSGTGRGGVCGENFDDSLFLGVDAIPDSRDSDRDGLGDFAELLVGWKVAADGGPLRQVFSSPRLRDSDGDALLDPVEADLRRFCEPVDPLTDDGEGKDYRSVALCAFTAQPPVDRADAIGIIAGPDGTASSVAGDINGDGVVDALDLDGLGNPSDDEDLIGGSTGTGLTYGTPIVGPGPNGEVETALRGDDLYEAASAVPPASDPGRRDTDLDGVNDGDELLGFEVGLAIVDGGNGYAETAKNGDDIQKAFPGNPVWPGGIVILPGPNGVIDSTPDSERIGDDREATAFSGATGDRREYIECGVNLVADTSAKGPDVQLIAPGDPCANPAVRVVQGGVPTGTDGFLLSARTEPNNLVDDDFERPAKTVKTDPLRRDSDDDTNFDGLEVFLGSDPSYPDGGDFRDGDQDGLTDAEEGSLGWKVTVKGLNGEREYTVLSSPSLPDTDFDGLPDFVERDLRTDPNKVDTDGDGLSDFDEMTGSAFARYVAIAGQYAGVSINGSASAQYGTDPGSVDTDGEGLSDDFELLEGYPILLPGGSQYELRLTNPLLADSDYDGATDWEERCREGDCAPGGNLALNAEGTPVDEPAPTDATDPDTDGDGRLDGVEMRADSLTDPLVRDAQITIRFALLDLKGGGTNTESGLTEWGWDLWVRRPADLYPGVLVSDAEILKDAAAPELDSAYRSDCNALEIGNASNIRFQDSAELTFAIKEGDIFAVSGEVRELDDCGSTPVAECVMPFQQYYSYDDFGSSAGIAETKSLANNGCAADVIYEVFTD